MGSLNSLVAHSFNSHPLIASAKTRIVSGRKATTVAPGAIQFTNLAVSTMKDRTP
ncbi:MAG: hypothetical protein OQK35_02810 [Alphaproteobacteria bacterium]|nr:hypothetical protein [Alphaproteobacteria bacterium]